ncbi:sulfite exporter TauE/SafE family protein [Bifidobacterium sp. UBA744]|uniref:sulfite exporter TauE/SafE family protein n=1 Tax=Bifidobacterium sp. UBA744 TaxID=1946112 RepID=UPI0025C64E71|nr:sulfite exporter TauE/SafE family protein [Bifidobacterium sp. UBA744]
MTDSHETALTPRNVLVMAGVGVLAGFLSGLFGIGGGTIIVPTLVWCGMTQRNAAATSLAAIVPISIVGVGSYAARGNVDWVAAILLAVGIVIGAQIGSWLLSRLPEKILQWAFVVFLLLVIVQQFIFIPSRDSVIHLTVLSGVALVAFGVVTGILSGILGIGGGTILVPALSLLFQASDLVARGSSLLAMFPGAISGTVSNARRRLVNVKVGLIIGVCACVMTPLGNLVASAVSARVNAMLFAAYLVFLLVRSLWVAAKKSNNK